MLHSMRSPYAALQAAALLLALAASASAQPPVHYPHAGDAPPGEIGRRQLERGGPRAGYFQPVELIGPEGSHLAAAAEGGFLPLQATPLKVGLLIGQAYRFRVAGIPLREGLEVFPTIEVIDRLYPPPGEEARFPIPIELTRQELDYALSGRYVTRVIYVENPENALPMAEGPHQRWFEVGPQEDPLQVADQLGRPVAILRIGSRIPVDEQPTLEFLHGSPPLLVFPPEPKPVAPEEVEPPAQRQAFRTERGLVTPRLYDEPHGPGAARGIPFQPAGSLRGQWPHSPEGFAAPSGGIWR